MTRTVRHPRLRRRSLFGLVVALSSSLATLSFAEVRVEGTPAAVRVTTSHDSIADVLSAVAATFDVKYRSDIRLDAVADGTSYSGSLVQVIARLLDGYSYVIKQDRQKTEIVVVRERGAAANPPEPPHPPPPATVVSRWR